MIPTSIIFGTILVRESIFQYKLEFNLNIVNLLIYKIYLIFDEKYESKFKI